MDLIQNKTMTMIMVIVRLLSEWIPSRASFKQTPAEAVKRVPSRACFKQTPAEAVKSK
jgi:hypothetical protein